MVLFAQPRSSLPRRFLFGFLAGFVSTLTFHQITIALLAALGALQASAYDLRAVPPLGLPQVINLAFWGGVWGCVWALVAPRAPRSMPVWLARVGIRRSPSLAGGLVRGGAPQRSANRGRLERRAAVDRAGGERRLGAWDGAALRTPDTIGLGPALVVALGQLSAQTVAGHAGRSCWPRPRLLSEHERC
jgi:hypothetical protein